MGEGLDLVVEGEAVNVATTRAERIAGVYVAKYGTAWRFEVRDGAFVHSGGSALVFEVAPSRHSGSGRADVQPDALAFRLLAVGERAPASTTTQRSPGPPWQRTLGSAAPRLTR